MKKNKINFGMLVLFALLGNSVINRANAMVEEELRARYLSLQPGGKIIQRDARLTAHAEITNSDDEHKIGSKSSWMFRGPLPSDYENMLTEPTLTALQDCPQEIRSKLAENHCKIAFTFDIGGTIHGPVIGQSGYPVNDPSGKPGRCVTIIDKNNLPTDIFW